MTAIEGYRVGPRIYESDRSLVHEAIREADGKRVVLKMLNREYPSPRELHRCREEYEITRSLKHPGVIQAFACLKVRGARALVLEDCGGKSLEHHLRLHHGFTPKETARLALALAQALAHIHENGVIHKDLTPANILYNQDTGDVKIIDFGIAVRTALENTEIAAPANLEGTLHYLSPEQTGRMNRLVDYRTDFYTLGATLYHLLAGNAPFPTDDPMELVHCHLARTPTPLHKFRDVPFALSAIISRLLAKNAEARYRGAWGLVEDLQRCLMKAEAGSWPAHFKPGLHDHFDTLQIPEKLYGRETEAARLLSDFELVRRGARRMVWVEGPAGIGKTALVREVYKPITAARGYVTSGKHDQYRQVPHGALNRAMGRLLRQITAEGEARLKYWKQRLTEHVGPHAALLGRMIPELALVLGPLPPVPTMGPRESSLLLRRAFRGLVQAFCDQAHPLVLFLDDLQWADLPTLDLVEDLLRDEALHHFLFIGAYRPDEAHSADVLWAKLRDMEGEGGPSHIIAPANLGLTHLTELCRDTLLCTRREARAPARLLLQRTGGNPFFAVQFLKSLYAENLVTYRPPEDGHKGGWTWDIAALEGTAFSDNVVDLMVKKLQELPRPTREALGTAAVLGPRFQLHALAQVTAAGPAQTVTALFPALREGMLFPVSEPEHLLDPREACAGSPHYKFLHDRVQQAAYALFDDPARRAAHLRVGLMLMGPSQTEVDEHHVFELVDHLNEARDLPEAAPHLPRLAALNLSAARKARAATAFGDARAYYQIAWDLRAAAGDPWTTHHKEALALKVGLAEACYLTADFETAETALALALARARTIVEKAEILDHHINLYTMNAQFGKVTRLGLDLLDELGLHIPREDPDACFLPNLARIRTMLAGKPISSLVGAPSARKTGVQVTQRILAALMPTVFFSDQAYFAAIVTEQVILSLKHGVTAESTSGFTSLAGMVTGRLTDPLEGYQWALLGLRLSERFADPHAKSQACHILGTYNIHWHRPFSDNLRYADEGLRTGLECGNHQWAGYNGLGKIRALFAAGVPLDRLTREVEAQLRMGKQMRNRPLLVRTRALYLGLCALKEGEEDSRQAEVAAWLAEAEALRDWQSVCEHHITAMVTDTFFGRHAAALAHHEAVVGLASYARGTVLAPLRNFYHSLALLAACRAAPEPERAALLAQVAANQKDLTLWAERCPENYENKRLLVAAETAGLEGRREDAADAYERAAQLADAREFFHEAALANELAAAYWRDRGHPKVARVCLMEARQAYLVWGAAGKLAVFEKQHAAQLDTRPTHPHVTGGLPSTTAGWELLSRLDLASVLKAARALSGEIVLEELLRKMMIIMLENAGAQRGFLLLNREETWTVAARASLEEATVENVPLAAETELCDSMVTYAARTRQTLVLEHAAEKGMFTNHPYVRMHRPKSVLCLPLPSHGHLAGMLYLENNLVEGAFTPERLEVLRLLSAQATVSLENAYLYANQEQLVAGRTQQLQQAVAQLEQKHEELKRAQDRLVQAEKIAGLGTLTAGVAHELKNPLNFINNFALLSLDIMDEVEEHLRRPGTATPEDAEFAELMKTLRLNVGTIAKHGRMADQTVQSMVSVVRDEKRSRRVLAVNGHVEHYLHMAVHENKTAQAVEVRTQFDPSAGFVEMSEKDLGRVWINLINNALDAFNIKHKRGDTSANVLTVRTQATKAGVAVCIRDNAIGMPAANRKRIFEPFFTTKPPGEGNIGLGLSICFDIVVKEHRGHIEVQSEEGAYTEFIVTLPAAAGEE